MANGGTGSGGATAAPRIGRIEAATVCCAIVLALGVALATLPRARPGEPPGPRELMSVLGSPETSAGATLSKLRLHRTHNDPAEFYYDSRDGCHAHLGVRLLTAGGIVVGWSRHGTAASRSCPAGTVADAR